MISVSEDLASSKNETTSLPDRAHRCHIVQDGHNRAEQIIYDLLWRSAPPDQPGDAFRLARVSVKRLAESPALRMTEKNVRIALRRLVEKLSLEEFQTFDATAKIPRVWKVFSYKSILERRRKNGMEWVVRSSHGVRFVRPQVGGITEVVTTPVVSQPTPVATTPVVSQEIQATPVATPQTTPVVTLPLSLVGQDVGVGKSSTSTTSPRVSESFLAALGRVDDEIVDKLVGACRQVAPDATEDEIVHFLQSEAARFRDNPKIRNLSGLMLSQVPKCFAGESLRLHREAVERERLQAEKQAAQKAEKDEQFLKLLLDNLASRNATEADKRMTRQHLLEFFPESAHLAAN